MALFTRTLIELSGVSSEYADAAYFTCDTRYPELAALSFYRRFLK